MGNNYKRSKTGIYKIVNLINNKIYVGSAVKISSRWANHRKKLRDGNHHSKYLQRSWDTHREDNFSFVIIEECDKLKLIEREQYYLDTLNPEYNMLKIAGSSLGYKHSKESNEKKSLNHSNKGKFGNESKTSIPIYQYSLDGKFLKIWHGAAEIQRELGYSQGNIRQACRSGQEHWTPYGFFWARTFLGDQIEPIKRRNRIKTCKPILMINDNGEIVKEFGSQKEAYLFFEKKTNADINHSLKDGKKRYGYYWKYKELD